MNLQFELFSDLLLYCQTHQCSIGQAALDYEYSRVDQHEQPIVLQRTEAILKQMQATIEAGTHTSESTLSGLSGDMALKLIQFMGSEQAFLSPLSHKMMAYSVATLEENSRMHRIVACPTAGGSGVVPAVLMALSEERGFSNDQLKMALLAAGLIGEIVSHRMFLSGSAAGCQAEVGVATGMSAGAIVELLGGPPEQALTAVAIALKNMMGLVCDPVAGLVEVPCVKRNAVGTMHACVAATMALAGITSFIPVDEVVEAMAKVGQMMSPKLKESAEGGLAATPTAQIFTEQFKSKSTPTNS